MESTLPAPELLEWVRSIFPDFEDDAGASAVPLPPAGSDRRLFRIALRKGTVILTVHPCPAGAAPNENDSYAYLARHLGSRGLPVPEVFAYSRELGACLVADLGDEDLDTLRRRGDEVEDLYLQGVELLALLQVRGREGFDPSRCHSPDRYDRELMLSRESGYFRREFLEGVLSFPSSPELDGECAFLADLAAGAGAEYLLHRDYQSRNLKVREGSLWIIDFQGARLGPPQYDLAALLYDPYADLDPAVREELMEAYLSLFLPLSGLSREGFMEHFAPVAAHRLMQAAGAYAFLGRKKGKREFLAFLPPALRLLGEVLSSLPGGEVPLLGKTARDAAAKLSEGD